MSESDYQEIHENIRWANIFSIGAIICNTLALIITICR